MTPNHAQEYFAKVLPWPQEGDPPAYVNIHWTLDKLNEKTGKPLWTGRAVRSLSEAVRTVEWAKSLADTRDIYVCLSTQREALEKKSRAGNSYLLPIRQQANAVAMRSLWLDLDAKGGDKNSYDTVSDAAVALNDFITKMGLPKPSALVTSGGGLHVYWSFDRALTPHEWQPLAAALAEAAKTHGLKCDTGCTIDGARVLRVPGTYNCKLDAPRPVGLAGGRVGHDYSVDWLSRILDHYRPAVVPVAPTLPPKPPLKGESELCAGIDMGNSAPIDLDAAAKQCGFIDDAIKTGGKDLTNPLWNLTTLLSTFTVGSRKDAHRMAGGHPDYAQASTDALFDRKERERQNKGLGWPACRTISASGAPQCALCPHYSADKTPFHFATTQPVATIPVTALVGGPSSSASHGGSGGLAGGDLPPGYKRHASNIVHRILVHSDGTSSEEPISSYPMYDPSIQTFPTYTLSFMTTTETGKATQVSIPTEEMSSKDSLRKRLLRQGVALREHESKAAMEFFMSWLEKLQKIKEAVVTQSPFGWSMDSKADIEGFVFGGSLWTPNGARNAAMPDPVLARRYKATGSRDPWIAAAKMITDQGRPALDAIIAASFGAPLIKFCGEPGIVMSVYSTESGIGKTSTMKVAQAIWGDPVRAMQGLDDTENFIFRKTGQLQNLPLLWDELKEDAQHKKFVKLAFKLTSRKEKDRLMQTADMRESGTFQTLLISASNDSIMDHVMQQTKQTAAGVYRVFEYEVSPATSSKGQLDQADASVIISKLDDHYGHIGLEYARYLGSNHPTIEKDVADFYKAVGKEMKTTNEERYWRVMVACLLKGAEYANKLGFTAIDGLALKKFLFGVVNNLRGARNSQSTDMAVTFNISSMLAQFLNSQRARHTIRTNKIHRARGKPQTGAIKILNDVTRLDTITTHIGVEDKMLRISSHAFSAWLQENGYSRITMIKALEKDFYTRQTRGRIASGTDFAGADEYLLEMDLSGTPHANFLDEA